MNRFNPTKVISDSLFQKITEVRVRSNHYVQDIAQKRVRRQTFVPSGRINIVAADHPARGSVSVGQDSFAMANRHDLLARLVSVLRSEWVDGVLASMDILEELLILHGLLQEGGDGVLDRKLLIASLNRGGMPGSAWELNDPVTGTDVGTCREYGLDAAKMLLRVDPKSVDSLTTMMACAEGIREMNRENLPLILEPLPVVRESGGYKVVKEPDPLIRLMGVASALGNFSRNLWLKIPYTRDFKRVVQATTLPIVILGGDRASLDRTMKDLGDALNAGHQVRGAMYGRNVLYPSSEQPVEVAERIGKLVHEKKAGTAERSVPAGKHSRNSN
ncbi:MAG: hypothetical protein WD035_09070 [Balneolaceae bacterium]